MPKKAFKRKKAYQRSCKLQAQAGKINDPSGSWISRGTKTSMERDFSPQRG